MEFKVMTPADAALLNTGLTFRATRPSLVLFS